MEFLNSNKHVFTKQLLIEKKKDYFKLPLRKIIEKWEKSGLIDDLEAAWDSDRVEAFDSNEEENIGEEALDVGVDLDVALFAEEDDDELDIF
jgi:hypothetical protein